MITSRPFRERIREREVLAGLIVKMPASTVIETAGHVGFDFVVIDTEHGARDASLLEAHLRAADAVGIPALVRVPGPNTHDILFALDAGATGLVIPRIVEVSDVDAVVDAAFYPPVGSRGLALSTRAGHHGLREVGAHIDAAQRETVLIVQIEEAAAIVNAADIADNPHVDAVFIGPNDLSLSIGLAGQLTHPDVKAAVAQVADAVLAQPDTALCMLATDADEALAWRERGGSMTILTSEVLIARWLRDLARDLRPAREAALPGGDGHPSA